MRASRFLRVIVMMGEMNENYDVARWLSEGTDSAASGRVRSVLVRTVSTVELEVKLPCGVKELQPKVLEEIAVYVIAGKALCAPVFRAALILRNG